MTVIFSSPLKKSGSYYKSSNATIMQLPSKSKVFNDVRKLGEKIVWFTEQYFPFKYTKVYDYYEDWELDKDFKEEPQRGYVKIILTRKWFKNDELTFRFSKHGDIIYVYQEEHEEYFGNTYVWKLPKEQMDTFINFLNKMEKFLTVGEEQR